jgi:ribose/xylose/arabinose/galactoside ABC-type transport system permease subunit
MTGLARRQIRYRQTALAILAVGLAAGFQQSFLTVTTALVVTVAIGLMFVVAAGGIDFSVGPIAVLTAGLPYELAVPLSLLIGVICGLVNGMLVIWTPVAPYLVTLAMGAVLLGPWTPVGDRHIATWLGFPAAVWVAAVIAVIAHIVLARTRLGMHVYFIGSNEETARLSGIRPNPVRLLAYVLSGTLAALAGALAGAGLGSAVELDLVVLAAVVVGGASLSGGRGTVLGTVLGSVLCVQVLEVTASWGISDYGQRCGLIVVLLFVITYNKWRLKSQV